MLPPLSPFAVIIATALFVSYALWKLCLGPYLQSRKPVEGLPTPPNCHPIFGHLWIFHNQTFENAMQNISYNFADSKGRTSMFEGNVRAVMLTRPEDVRAVLMNEYQHKIIPILSKHFVKFLGKKNIGMLSGRLWKHERSIILKSVSPTSLTQEAMQKVTTSMVTSLKQRLGSLSEGAIVFDVERLMKMITLDVFGLAAFSHNFGSCEKLKLSSIAEAFDFLGSDLFRRMKTGPLLPSNFFYGLPNKYNKRHKKESTILRDFVSEAVRSSRNQPTLSTERKDLVTRLVEAHETAKGTSIAEECTDEVLQDVLVSLVFAGFDTTSVTLSYALYVVGTNPAILEECRKEIDRVGIENPDNLEYVRATIKEVLRLYPPGFVTTRFLQKPVNLNDGFVIPSNVNVLVPIWAIQRSDRNFPCALACRPERWVQWTTKSGGKWEERTSDLDSSNDPASIPVGNKDAFLVFSAGARSCPGQKFAWQEAVIVFAGLLKDLNFHPIEGYKLQPERCGIVQHPEGGIPLRVSLRDY